MSNPVACEGIVVSSSAEYQATEQGFFASIEENPHELANWLIFADFLEDHDHPCAEITRLWASRRFGSAPLREQERARLEALLTLGLRPCLPRYVNTLGMEFTLVPGGTFWMSQHDKNAQRQVEIPHNFYIGAYPVTQGEWEAVMGNNPSCFSGKGKGNHNARRVPDSELKRYPVENVSWNDCERFLEHLNKRERENGWLYRLPMEAEWEYACRGAAISREECSFDFYFKDILTNDLTPDLANYANSRMNHTTKVGSYPENVLGIFDMHGTVWEWCQDWYQEGASRIVRGGGWRLSDWGCRAAWRYYFTPVHKYDDTGLRVVRVPAGK